ncbi:MAG: LPP20 family lipoprotein [Treponema sp.]|jgi:hypothetical protein|nr:LPP20 family lipoprotein [Treponema sp.]
MFKVVSLVLIAGIMGTLVGCGSTPPSHADAKAEAAAQAAVAEMTGEPRPAPSGSSAEKPPVRGGKEPAWVADPYTAYSKNDYVAAVGYGSDRSIAEKSALVSLTSVFGQNIKSQLDTLSGYSESVTRGGTEVSKNSSVKNAITIIVEMQSLVGAEIGEVWYDNKRTYYAVAILEKANASTIYPDMIRSNQGMIDELLAMSAQDKNSLEGYSRYQLAAIIADANEVYGKVLSMVGNTSNIVPADLKTGNSYRLEAANIVKNLPIGLVVTNDQSNRIEGAFADVIYKAGFKSGGTNSRYMLRVKVTLDPVEYPNNTNKFARWVVDANLTDTVDNSILLPFNINGREGHVTLSEAINRAVATAEKKIGDSYGGVLSGYFSALLK